MFKLFLLLIIWFVSIAENDCTYAMLLTMGFVYDLILKITTQK